MPVAAVQTTTTTTPITQPQVNHTSIHNGLRLESRRPHVRLHLHLHNWRRITLTRNYSYNRYLAVAARVVRRSLKEDKRLAAERRGEMDLRFAKWSVRTSRIDT